MPTAGCATASSRPACLPAAVGAGTTATAGRRPSITRPICENGGGVVTLDYTRSGIHLREPDDLGYTIELTSTVPRFGGLRWWFICPLVVNGRDCGRRVGKLYLPDGARYFGCRHCHDLVYRSSQEARKPGALLFRISAQVGCSLRDVKRALRKR